MMKMNKKGFTIVELVIVIAVIAILAAVMIPTFSGIVSKANQSALLQKVTAEYKEAYALALADGVIATNEQQTATNGTYTFTFNQDATGAISCTVIPASANGFNISIQNGNVVITE